MATDPAARPRNFWQLPTFALGLAAAAAAGQFVPAPVLDPAAVHKATLTGLRTALAQKPVTAAKVEQLARAVADMADRNPGSSGESHFLAGSGFAAAAAAAPPEADDDLWKRAVEQFAACDPKALSGDDARRLTFREAVAKASLDQGDPAILVPALTNVPDGDDKIEAGRLIAEQCLKLTPPDRKRAKDELNRYLALPNRLTPADAARRKLMLATLHLDLKEPAEARRWLRDIGPTAPADVQATAKLQLGRLALRDKDYAEAVKLFDAAQSGVPADQQATVSYQAGVAHLMTGSPAAAAHFELAAKDPGPTGAAAALRLAEIAARGPTAVRANAADWLDKAAARAAGPDEFAAHDLTPPQVRAAFEEVIKACKADGQFAAAVRAATAYSKFAANGADRERRAEANAAWAEALKANPAEAADKFRAAAADYAAAADGYPTTAGKADLYRRAITLARTGGDAGTAAATVAKLLAVPDLPPEDVAFAHLEHARSLPATDAGKKAALEKAMAGTGPAASAARLELALMYIDAGQKLLADAPGSASPDQQRQQGEQMAKLGRHLLEQAADATTVSSAEQPTHERSVFELARRLMAEQKYPDAEARFRKLLKLYPDGGEAGMARLWMACCLLQQGNAGGPADPRLDEAVALLAPLRGSTDTFLRAQADIRTLNAMWVQQKFDGVQSVGKEMLAAYRGKPDELVIGKLMFYAAISRTPADLGEALAVLLRMEAAIKEIPPAAFPTDPEYAHDRWQRELPALRQEYEKRAK